jgi:ATP-dependent exoDNAse (exonuclease V) beta subunit
VIHGVMDVIYRYGEQWHILDYKTADISARSVPEHAKRYAIQLGAYAQALQERLGSPTPPSVQLYYLHPSEWIELPPAQWAAAMRQFEHWVQQALSQ